MMVLIKGYLKPLEHGWNQFNQSDEMIESVFLPNPDLFLPHFEKKFQGIFVKVCG